MAIYSRRSGSTWRRCPPPENSRQRRPHVCDGAGETGFRPPRSSMKTFAAPGIKPPAPRVSSQVSQDCVPNLRRDTMKSVKFLSVVAAVALAATAAFAAAPVKEVESENEGEAAPVRAGVGPEAPQQLADGDGGRGADELRAVGVGTRRSGARMGEIAPRRPRSAGGAAVLAGSVRRAPAQVLVLRRRRRARRRRRRRRCGVAVAVRGRARRRERPGTWR